MNQLALDWDSPVTPNIPFQKTTTSNVVSILINDKWSNIWKTLKNNEDLNFLDKTTGTSLSTLIWTATEAIYKALLEGYTIFIGYSGGKDSNTVLMLFLMALLRAHREGHEISPHHCIQHTDTGVESPEVADHAKTCLYDLEEFIEKHQLPLTTLIATPGLTQSWTGRILTGRGLPTFVGSHRQCSIDMKINPAKKAKKNYLKNIVSVRANTSSSPYIEPLF